MDLTVNNYNVKTPAFRAHFTKETASMIQAGILDAVKLEKNPIEAEKLNRRLTKLFRNIERILDKKFGKGEVSLLSKEAEQGRAIYINVNGYGTMLPREMQKDKFAFIGHGEELEIVKFPAGQLGRLGEFLESLKDRVGAKLSRSSKKVIERGITHSSEVSSASLNPEVVSGYYKDYEKLEKILGAKSKVKISFDNEQGTSPKVTKILVQDGEAYKKYPLPEDLIPAFTTEKRREFFVSGYKIESFSPEYLDKLCEYFKNLKV